MYENFTLYRKRFIPQETIKLKDDEILYADNDYIVTRWKVLKPRPDFAGGISLYCRKQGFKVSRFCDKFGNLVYWYCDIVREVSVSDGLLFEDLLLDVVVGKDGSVKVLDMGEAADAREKGFIDEATLDLALHTADSLLSDVYAGRFAKYQKMIEKYL